MLKIIIFTISLINQLQGAYPKGKFFVKNFGYKVNTNHNPFKVIFSVQSDLFCLTYCNNEPNCLTAYFNEKLETCSIYDSNIDCIDLDSQVSSAVYTIKNNRTTINFPRDICKPPNEIITQTNLSVYGITEISDQAIYFIANDNSNKKGFLNRINWELAKSIKIYNPRYITNSQKFIYVNSDWSKIVRINFELNESSAIIVGKSMRDIYFDLSTKNLYVANCDEMSINIYHTNDEVAFNLTRSIDVSFSVISISILNDEIYTGTLNGTILVYNKTDNTKIKEMVNMCSKLIRSIKFDNNGNMIYSCSNRRMVKIKGLDFNSTLLLNDIFTYVYDSLIDTKNRLWVGGNDAIVIFY